MSIPPGHAHRCIYHFTHIGNLPNLLKTGFLCNNHPEFPKAGCRSIAEQGIQERRARMVVPCGPGGKVHDFVPLYFAPLSPMLLAVINKKNVDQMDIIYFEFPISLLSRDDVVFTDASANTAVPPNFFSDPADLDKLNWTEIDSLKWKSANETLRHQRMAEVLAHKSVSLQDAARVVVWNKDVKQSVEKIVSEAGAKFPPIVFQHPPCYHYFVKFENGDEKGQSIVTGPRAIANRYKEACKGVAAQADKQSGAAFGTHQDLLSALRTNFGCLPQTAELVGLKSANGIHKRTVDVHSQEVAAKLLALPEFQKLPLGNQELLELSAYLHDIGKGPKARWNKHGGEQQVDPDHPVRALPMVVEILTQKIAGIKQGDAEVILKLVCYHDLVGDALGRGRDEQQIVDVAQSKLELDMLFALGKADATSLVEWWWREDSASALYDRCLKAIKARGGE